jgi:hypothetical protein
MKLSKLEHIFVTYPSWENIGGLPGVALTIQDVGVPEITLHGPAGTVCYVSFIVLGNCGLFQVISHYFQCIIIYISSNFVTFFTV